MTVPNSDDILAVARDHVPEFIQHHAATKTLSRMVKSLNHDLLNGDDRASDLAARALDHLGLGQ